MTESEWKLFRRIREVALERFCQRVLSEMNGVALDTRRAAHDRYLAVYRLLQDRDEELAGAFNDPRRSNALLQLMQIRALSVLTDEELAQFSVETRDAVGRVISGFRSAGEEEKG